MSSEPRAGDPLTEAELRELRRSAYHQGRAARRAGLTRDAVPDSGLRPHWLDGYNDESEGL